MLVSEPHVYALSPNAEEAACSGDNHLGVDVPNPEVDDKPDWLKRLEMAKESQGDVVLVGGERYRIGKKLGDGSFGVVFEGTKLSEDGPLPVAIKFVGDPT